MSWDKLENVQGRINYLEEKRLRMMMARCKELHEYHCGPSQSFSSRLENIETELYELWAEKRYLLALLDIPSELSWVSLEIQGSRASQGPLQMSRRDLDLTLLE